MDNPKTGYTRLNNLVIENLYRSGLNGTELSICLLILRKTVGFKKETDQISLSQFMENIPATKPSICTALKKLQLVKIIKLVKKGKSRISSNEYKFNDFFDEWQLVKKTKLVKNKKLTSKENFTHKRNIQKKEKDTNVSKNTPAFSKPTLEEIKSYCLERHNSVDPEKWLDHYTSNGFKVGRNQMKDWKAAVRNWERSNGNGGSTSVCKFCNNSGKIKMEVGGKTREMKCNHTDQMENAIATLEGQGPKIEY